MSNRCSVLALIDWSCSSQPPHSSTRTFNLHNTASSLSCLSKVITVSAKSDRVIAIHKVSSRRPRNTTRVAAVYSPIPHVSVLHFANPNPDLYVLRQLPPPNVAITMAIRRTDALNDMFESHPSLTASLEEFENNDNPSPVFRLPSQHSGFKSDDSDADATSNSEPPWSPQHWRRPDTGSGWYRHQPYRQESPVVRLSASPTRSRETSPKYESADENKEDYTIPANVPLPRGSVSPAKERPPSPPPFVEGGQHFRPTFVAEEINEETIPPASHNNCGWSVV